MNSFSELFFGRAQQCPDALAFRFFKGGVTNPETLTVGELWTRAASLAQDMLDRGCSGQRVLIACKAEINFAVAFYACLLSGAIAVPTPLPKRQALLSRLEMLAVDARIGGVLTDGDDVLALAWPAECGEVFQFDLRALALDDGARARAAAFVPPALSGASPAFLQYTSGSVGTPKGVIVSHANLLQNCAAIQDAMEVTPATPSFIALPLFHDMGLVGGILAPIFIGNVANLMSPAEFVQYPERWLQIVSAYGVVVSGGPNFMFELAARAIEDEHLDGLDLSRWRVAFCGAEPIRADTVARFAERFKAVGFDANAFYPCYGMAESTLFISGPKAASGARIVVREDGTKVVGCGHARADTRIEIVDPDTCRRVEVGQVGEVWVASASVSSGYWMRPDETAHAFAAQIRGDEGIHFLRTGDLGFFDDNQLFITGRLKDLIIVYGKKYVPQDIELEAVRSHPGLRDDCSAAFAVSDGRGDRLVVVCELTREWWRRESEWSQLRAAVQAGVANAFGVRVDDVVPIKPGTLPRTSSGKVRRSQCRTDYLNGALHALPSAPAVAESAQAI